MLASHSSTNAVPSSGLGHLEDIWLLFAGSGVVLVILGAFTMGSAFIATLTSILLFGSLLVICSIFQIVDAFWASHSRGFALCLGLGVLYLILGIALIDHPLPAALGMTMLVAMGLMVGGLMRITLALVERWEGWHWLLMSGIVTLLLGISIWKQWPFSGLWVIGLFLGIEMVLMGLSWFSFGMALRARKLLGI